jgi:hypothetical protein
MKSLDFPVAAPVAAPIKFAWISWSGAITQERKAVRGFTCVIVVATLAGAIAKVVGAITRAMVDERLTPLVRRLQSKCAGLAASSCEQGSGHD